jgi:hypothetical protein
MKNAKCNGKSDDALDYEARFMWIMFCAAVASARGYRTLGLL